MRILHTADWQLGMRRRFLPEDAQHRYGEARFEAVRRLVEVAREEGCAAIVVAGDAFESSRVDRQTVERAMDALTPAEGTPVPVILLPGNHDPLDGASVWRRSDVRRARPGHVTVLESNEPVEVEPGLEVVGAPWRSKRPPGDLVGEALAGLEPASGVVRVLVGHGACDGVFPHDDASPFLIRLDPVRRALESGAIHYLALGDRHSVTRVDDGIAYAGTPEVTDFDEERPGRILVVDLADGARLEEHPVGRWRFLRETRELGRDEDVDGLDAWLDELADKVRTVLRLTLEGQLSLHAHARLEEVLERAGERFAAVERWRDDLTVLPDEMDEDELALSGFARDALERLRTDAVADDEARGALALLYRLARGTA